MCSIFYFPAMTWDCLVMSRWNPHSRDYEAKGKHFFYNEGCDFTAAAVCERPYGMYIYDIAHYFLSFSVVIPIM